MVENDTALESVQDGKFIYRYAQPSLGASATVVFKDIDADGELKTLMVRRRRDEQYWTYPAVYAELITEQNAGAPSPQDIIGTHFPQLQQRAGWQLADITYNRGLRAVLAGYGLQCPEDSDVSQLDAMMREVKEETGINLTQYPDAKIDFVRSELSYWYSSGNQRPYTANPHYLVDLGEQSAAELKLRFEGEAKDEREEIKEIKEMAWVPVQSIFRQKEKTGDHGIYKVWVNGKIRDLSPYVAPAIELSMHKWLSNQIENETGKRMSTPANVQAWLKDMQIAPRNVSGVGWPDDLSQAIGIVREMNLSEQGTMESLVGEDGKLRANSFIKVASHLSAVRRMAASNTGWPATAAR